MEDQRKFALDDDMLDSVAGGTDDIGLMYDGWWLDTQIPCQETPGCTETVVACFSYGPCDPRATIAVYKCICIGCWRQRFGLGLDSPYITRNGWKP